MIKKAQIVIGAGYGDEGKGLMTAYYGSKNNDAPCIRFNSGAQAGHTVVDPDTGIRHVFSHISSATFTGNPTYLSEYFVTNPILFHRELMELRASGWSKEIKIIVHPASKITFPSDVFVNQILEHRRGNDRHGSCGVGFGETIRRNEESKYKMNVGQMSVMKKDQQVNYMRECMTYAVIELGGMRDKIEEELLKLHESLYDVFTYTFDIFLHMVEIRDYTYLKDKEHIILEGAQGLMLDIEYGTFPHITRSHTGLKNAMNVINHIGGGYLIDVNYVSRSYTTRHGAGPLSFESNIPYNIVDKTNVENPHQGILRFAPYNLDNLSLRHKDFNNYSGNTHSIRPRFTVTCMDQINREVEIPYIFEGNLFYISAKDFITVIYNSSNFVSDGPTYKDVTEIQDSRYEAFFRP